MFQVIADSLGKVAYQDIPASVVYPGIVDSAGQGSVGILDFQVLAHRVIPVFPELGNQGTVVIVVLPDTRALVAYRDIVVSLDLVSVVSLDRVSVVTQDSQEPME